MNESKFNFDNISTQDLKNTYLLIIDELNENGESKNIDLVEFFKQTYKPEIEDISYLNYHFLLTLSNAIENETGKRFLLEV